jgi:hypothetical protein
LLIWICPWKLGRAIEFDRCWLFFFSFTHKIYFQTIFFSRICPSNNSQKLIITLFVPFFLTTRNFSLTICESIKIIHRNNVLIHIQIRRILKKISLKQIKFGPAQLHENWKIKPNPTNLFVTSLSLSVSKSVTTHKKNNHHPSSSSAFHRKALSPPYFPGPLPLCHTPSQYCEASFLLFLAIAPFVHFSHYL